MNGQQQNIENQKRESTAVATTGKAPIAMGRHGLQLTTLDEAYRFAQYVIAAGLAPRGMSKPEQVLIAVQAGAELGFSPMRALSAITVINGKPGLMGEAAIAKIQETQVCLIPPVIRIEGEGDARRGVVRFQRKTMPEPVEVDFSVADAKKAHLWGKQGPWTEYPDDMLGWRAVARMCKRYFGDVTMGLTIAEELRDYPAPTNGNGHDPAPPAEPDPLLTNAVHHSAPSNVIESEIVAPSGSDVGTSSAASSTPRADGPRDGAAASAEPAATSPITEDEASRIRAVEKLENAMVVADSVDQLNHAWTNGAGLVAQLADKERKRLERLYRQNLKNFESVAK